MHLQADLAELLQPFGGVTEVHLVLDKWAAVSDPHSACSSRSTAVGVTAQQVPAHAGCNARLVFCCRAPNKPLNSKPLLLQGDQAVQGHRAGAVFGAGRRGGRLRGAGRHRVPGPPAARAAGAPAAAGPRRAGGRPGDLQQLRHSDAQVSSACIVLSVCIVIHLSEGDQQYSCCGASFGTWRCGLDQYSFQTRAVCPWPLVRSQR